MIKLVWEQKFSVGSLLLEHWAKLSNDPKNSFGFASGCQDDQSNAAV